MTEIPRDSQSSPVSIPRTLVGLLSGLLVAMLASSIVSTSLPRIAGDLGGGQGTLTWIVTATLLAITVSTPIWGKLSDLLSRKALLCAALVLFVAGSLLAGFAPEPLTLIVGRALQGLGAGGLLSLVQIVMADIISPRERGKYMGLFGAVMAFGTIGGPLIGGLVTDVFGWRWNFFASAPIALFSLVIIFFTLPAHVGRGRARIDYVGALLITLGISGVLVWVTLGGSLFAWDSPTSWLTLGASVLVLVLAIVVETKVPEPILPIDLFRNPGFVLTVVASASVGVATYGAAVFMSQYLQLARGSSATDSSLAALPQLIAVTIASTVVGALISRSGNWKRWMVFGACCQTVGMAVLGTITTQTPMIVIWVCMALVGTGIGSIMQNLVLMAEINVSARQLGVASAGVVFFRTLGGAIGVAGLGALIQARSQSLALTQSDWLANAGYNTAPLDLANFDGAGAVAGPVQDAIQAAYARAIGDAYLVGAALAALTVCAILLLPAKPLSTRTRQQRLEEEGEGDSSAA